MLLLFGLIYCGVAYSIPGAADYRPELVHTHLPIVVRILIWLVPGLVAIGFAWDGRLQGWGFGCLFISPAERCASYGAALIINPGLVTDRDTWSPLPGLLVYAFMAITMLILSGWPEPPDGERVEYEMARTLERIRGAVDQVEAERRHLTELPSPDGDQPGGEA